MTIPRVNDLRVQHPALNHAHVNVRNHRLVMPVKIILIGSVRDTV